MKPCVPPIDMFSPPWQVFPKYMAALDAFYSMVHSPEFQTYLTLREGELLVMNNWRTMHGRAGLAGKTRTILGGTVTREAAPPPAPPTPSRPAEGCDPYRCCPGVLLRSA